MEKSSILEKIKIEDYASDGKALTRVDNKIHFVKGVVPGDVVDLQIIKSKKKYTDAKAIHFHALSEYRINPICRHFGTCGGCSWQNLNYHMQLFYKQKEVDSTFQKLKLPYTFTIFPIISSEDVFYYRNKLEFTFSNKSWVENPNNPNEISGNALGFHVPGRFDKVLPIEQCHLQLNENNSIRNFIKEYAQKNHLDFFDIRNQQGFLRNLIIRNTSLYEWMVILVFAENNIKLIKSILEATQKEFPFITSLLYIVNTKKNDTIFDQEVILFSGKEYITERLEHVTFKISPKSFFQINHKQTILLYKKIIEWANFSNTDIVYDLYCGTGSISLFIAHKVKKVVGVEYIADAILDAKQNALDNHIHNAEFICGDIAHTLDNEFFNTHGIPDVIILDPPRSGLHPKVIEAILNCGVKKIVYVSCNVQTQVRDLEMLQTKYKLIHYQPFDMFPHTKHIENIILLHNILN